MSSSSLTRKFLSVALSSLVVAQLSADTVEIKNGARILGKITKIDGGSVVVSTDYAGTITIKQSEVVSIATDEPVAIRLASGTRFDGKVSAGTGGAIQIAGADGTINTTMDKVAASWGAGKVDPLVDRHWTYEASADVAGKTGNKEQLGMAAEVRATLKTTQDTLQFYSGYNRQVSKDEVPDPTPAQPDRTKIAKSKSADQFKLGVDYQNNFKGRYSWYVRDEGGFDRVKDIELYNIAAVGMGYDILKERMRTITGRLGLAFRYEGYRDPTTPDVKSAGLDIGLNSDLDFGYSKLVTRIAYVPTFEDFGNYRLTHESYYQIPMAHPSWKLRLGVANDYNSQPPLNVEKLDTAYFVRLVLNWE